MIQEIIIISNTGIPLFNYAIADKVNKNYDYRLIASYFDQICRFTRYGFNESLVTLKLNKSEFYFYTHPEKLFHLIIKVDDKKINKKLIDSLANELFEKFSAKFKTNLIHFDGNINRFKPFRHDIEDVLKSKELKPLLSSPL